MPKIQNNFLIGTVNKDLDERITPNGQLVDAENFMVTSEDGSNAGVGKGLLGTVEMRDFGLNPNDNPECIGVFPDEGRNLLYIFITSDDRDYVIKYNAENNTSIELVSTPNGGLLNFSKDYRITHADIFTSVEDSDLLSWTDGLNPPRIINTDKIYPSDVSEEEISVMKPAPKFPPSIVPVTTTTQNTENLPSNELEDRFVAFAYRWKYTDGYYSSFSPFSEYYFIPSPFSIDFDAMENLGMINAVSQYLVEINTGERDVIGVDVVFKYEGLPNVYVLDKYKKNEENWTDNSLRRVLFLNNKRYSTLPESQWFRSFDNVPLTALSQKKIGNRLVYGNFTEGRDLENPVIFSVGFKSDVILSDASDVSFETNLAIFTFPEDFEYKEGESFSVRLNLTVGNNPNEFQFDTTALYVLESDFSDFQDFISNSGFVNYIETDIANLFDTFVTNNFVNYENLVVVSNFVVTSPEDLTVAIAIPQLTYSLNDVINFAGSVGALAGEFISPRTFRYNGNPGFALTCDVEITFPSSLGTYTLKVFKDGFLYQTFTDTASASPVTHTFISEATNSNDAAIRGLYTFSIVSDEPCEVALKTEYTDFTVIQQNGTVTETSPLSTSTVNININSEYNSVVVDFATSKRSSMKSNRSYEVGLIYKDNQGRKTTVFPSEDNTIYIPHENAINKNTLTVDFPLGYQHPSWADTYQFVVKQNRLDYQTIYGNIFYQDGTYRWVKLEGESKDKVKENDMLIVKQDLDGVVSDLVKLKVLEVKGLDGDFIEDNVVGGEELKEEAGLYMRVRPDANIALNYENSTFATYEGRQHLRYPSRTYTSPAFPSYGVLAGSRIRIFINIKARGSISFNHTYDRTFTATTEYPTFEDWFNAEVQNLGSFGINYTWNGVSDIGNNVQPATPVDETNRGSGWGFEDDNFWVVAFRKGTASRSITTTVKFEVRESSGNLIFETEPVIDSQDIYFETPQVYRCSDGLTSHELTRTYNCFSFGNGVESNRYKDRFNARPFYIDFFPTSVSEDEYRQVRRFADLTYSEVYQESTNVNRLNEFNLSLANFKDDIEKAYGAIIRLDSDETDLLVIQEGKTSKVLYGKDLLFNADATTNLSRISQVLGQQVMYAGEYGISTHPESYSEYGTNAFWTDLSRGVVMRLNNTNGLYEISEQGMTDYFKELFRGNAVRDIISGYDSFYDIYILNVKLKNDDYLTWYYSPKNNGFLTRASFNPDAMARLNNRFFSLRNGVLYEHNKGAVNNFYGIPYDSTFSFNFSQEPSTRKIFKAISIEGSKPANMVLKTDLQNGGITQSNFIKKEGVWFSHIRGEAGNVDLASSSIIGLGNLVSLNGNLITLPSVSSQVSIGDTVYNQNQQVVGVITDITGNTIEVSPVNNLTPNVFLYAVKSQRINTSGLTGYYMRVDATVSGGNQFEIFAVNTDIAKSFE
jgi:hypothetical protein